MKTKGSSLAFLVLNEFLRPNLPHQLPELLNRLHPFWGVVEEGLGLIQKSQGLGIVLQIIIDHCQMIVGRAVCRVHRDGLFQPVSRLFIVPLGQKFLALGDQLRGDLALGGLDRGVIGADGTHDLPRRLAGLADHRRAGCCAGFLRGPFAGEGGAGGAGENEYGN